MRHAERNISALVFPCSQLSEVRPPDWLDEAANEARERVRKAYLLMDEIDRRAELSRDDKYRQRSKTAAQAIADFEESKTLVRAREAVERAVAKRNCEGHVSPETARPRLRP